MDVPTVIPPMLYVLCESVDSEQLSVTVQVTRDGERALLAYSALDRLYDCCGRHYPWAIVRTDELDQIDEHVPFDVVVLDIELPVELKRTAA